jgi:mycothiol system anti-sigma-R factor
MSGADDRTSTPSPECSEALARLFEFLDAEIADVEADRIRQHLADCEPCLGEYDAGDHLKKLIRRSCSDVAPAELHARIRDELTALRMRYTSPD